MWYIKTIFQHYFVGSKQLSLLILLDPKIAYILYNIILWNWLVTIKMVSFEIFSEGFLTIYLYQKYSNKLKTSWLKPELDCVLYCIFYLHYKFQPIRFSNKAISNKDTHRKSNVVKWELKRPRSLFLLYRFLTDPSFKLRWAKWPDLANTFNNRVFSLTLFSLTQVRLYIAIIIVMYLKSSFNVQYAVAFKNILALFIKYLNIIKTLHPIILKL